MQSLIALDRVSKIYRMPGEEVHALRELSLEVIEGEFLSIVGSSGSGKTTLLYLLGLLTDPSEGSYVFGGEDVSHLGDRDLSRIRGREIGFVFQAFHLISQKTVLENVLLSARYGRNGLTSATAETRARSLLDRVGLAHRLRHRPRELSGGEMQRVAIARALLTEPRLILADEPTGNLDQTNGEEVCSLLAELSEDGHTVILVTHDLALADRAGRRIQLQDGRAIDA
jgi:putative ABC transport system ATP-binding protein